MKVRFLPFLMLPILGMAQANSNGEIPLDGNTSSEKQTLEIKRNASFNLDEIKVRWKKAALENCTGVPCVVTPPAPAFTCGISTISDVDNNVYETVLIGTQCWTKQNLRVSNYNDGSPIDFDNAGGMDGRSGGYNPNPWIFRSAGAYTIYANDGSTGTNASNYGFLYNWYAAAGIIASAGAPTKNICPVGWLVPSDPDWTTLIEFHGGIIGDVPTLFSVNSKMKQKGTTLWNNPNNGTDDYGFTALPGGQRTNIGTFEDVNTKAWFWSATDISGGGSLISNWSTGPLFLSTNSRIAGLSVRCLKLTI
jgi:uncharacterized protein (TIGR02145 family)